MNSSGGGGGVGVAGLMAMRSPFTVSQWQELEHQALIFKYMMAGLPVPPDLVLPIRKSFESISHRFFHHPTMGYCTFYGKKVDPEPGRCRRTDGKKWRCSKDAYPNSKYCERHMHRGRNRSRKPVESQTMTQSSSTVTSVTVTGSSSSGSGSFPNLPLHTFANGQATDSGTNETPYNINTIPYGIPSKDYRYAEALKPDNGEHSFFSEGPGSNRGLQMDSPPENAWSLMQSRISSFQASKTTDNSMLQNDHPPHSFLGGKFATREPGKHDGQSLRPFLDEWPKNRTSWSGLEENRGNKRSFSTTQLSISIPMASSDFSTSGSRSPHSRFFNKSIMSARRVNAASNFCL